MPKKAYMSIFPVGDEGLLQVLTIFSMDNFFLNLKNNLVSYFPQNSQFLKNYFEHIFVNRWMKIRRNVLYVLQNFREKFHFDANNKFSATLDNA